MARIGSGKYRLRVIRSMARRGVEECRQRVAVRRARYLEIKKHGIEPLTEMMFRQYHDAEYALSIAEGTYDPKSDINRFVRDQMAQHGHEVTMVELLSYHSEILAKLWPVVAKHDVPREYGALMRFCRAIGLGKKKTV